MEVLFTPDYYIFRRGDSSLWFKRNSPDSKALLKTGYDFNQLTNLTCLGLAHGLIGKFGSDNLIVIRQNQCVGTIPGVKGSEDEVYRIKRIAIIQLNDVDPNPSEIALEPCTLHDNNPLTGVSNVEHEDGSENQMSGTTSSHSLSGIASGNGGNTGGVFKTWSSIRSATSSVKSSGNLNKSPRGSFAPGKEKGERRLINEVLKMFNNTDSFYYSPTGDLSNSLQMKHILAERKENKTSSNSELSHDEKSTSDNVKYPWDVFDKRFIWNRHMMDSLISGCEEEITGLLDLNFWIVPVVQGFFQSETCFIDGDKLDGSDLEFREYQMILISRRSRFRAGTRYKRRGLDEDGYCANYVETEQIFKYGAHVVSFVQVRGSVPIFWSQPGHAYRPPPRIDRSEEETQRAFEAHFQKEFAIYGREVIINLIERWGRERVVGEAYLNHTVNFDSPLLTYVSFDFHERCRGMKFENVSILIANIKDIIRDMKYCWVDDQGVIQSQDGVFRVNCIDCLDRTNIAQTAIARTVMDTQFSKLGVLCPDSELPPNCRRIFQIMWANNGDSISRQYAGTNALKGDYTRTGERRLAGMVKDSYNSASRYLQNRFKDAYRQAAIDMMQGNPISDSDLRSPDSENVYGDDDDDEDIEHHERVKQVIEDCKKILIPENEVILGGWPLIDADPSNDTSHPSIEMDTVLILTKDCYYVAEYDDQTDRITKYQKVLLEDLEKIEFGPEPGAQLLFSSLSSKLQKQSYCIRFHYLVNGQSGYFHMFRPTNTRFFNNMAIPVRTPQESIDSLKAICESFKVALCVKSLNVPLYEGRLEKRKSKTVSFAGKQPTSQGSMQPRKVRHYTHSSVGQKSGSSLLPRNISDGNLLNLKNVGSRALNNVSCQLARFKGKLTGNARSNPHLALGTVSEQRLESIQSFAGVDTSVASSEEDIYDEEWEGAVGVTTDEISEDESLRKSNRTRMFRDQQASIASNASSVFLTERTLSSDYSECSDLEDTDDIILGSLCEEPRSLPFQNAAALSLAGNDTLLESCGILTISPPLKPDYEESGNANNSHGHRGKNRKSLLKDVDDFVIDAMNKAGLKQLHRKASESLTSLPLRGKYPSIPSTSQPRAPQIEISDSASGFEVSPPSPTNQPRARKLSKSSEDIESFETLSTRTLCNTSSASCAALSGLPANEENRIGKTDDIPDPSCAKSSTTLQITPIKMKTSHSEMALGQSQENRLALNINSSSNLSNNPLSSPILMKKDLILSPISRIAKGVHSFGLNLRSHYSSENQQSTQVYDPKACGKNYEKTTIIFI
ncbi:phosphatidylinositide phosphatase SAC2 [Tetranychus urticae]|uniref:SAC domain-containing protein n=1 Tax=Tetranychus urticae TaxID=32264 RepID=T1KD31_TETUR|nr:phosphatidylinositide phosphatase SAC2 [Tetranychus urticae]